MRPRQARKQEAVDTVRNGSGEDLGERARVTSIRPPECVQIPRPITLVDDRGRIPVPDEQEVRRQPADSPVALGGGDTGGGGEGGSSSTCRLSRCRRGRDGSARSGHGGPR